MAFFRLRAFFLLLLLSGCAIAPLTQGGPARPVGEGHFEGAMQWSGYSNGGTYVLVPSGKVRYGISPRWTANAFSEGTTLTLSAQNAYFLPESSPFAAAVDGGIVYAAGNLSYFIGHTLSGRWGDWEPFLGLQFFLANATPGSFDATFFSTQPNLHPVFFVVALGTRYWITESIAVGLHFNALLSSNSVVFQYPFLQNLSLAFTW